MHFQGTPVEFAHSTDAVVTGFRDSALALGTALASLRHGGSLPTED